MHQQNQRVIVRVSDTTLSFVTQASDGEIIYEPFPVRSGMSMSANMREAFKESNILLSNPQRAFVCIDSPTLVLPLEDAQNEKLGLQYEYVYPNQKGCSIETFLMPSLNAVIVYSVNKDLKLVMEDNFADVRLLPLMAPTWEFMLRRSVGGNNKKMFAYFHDGKLNICIFNRNRFTFVNSFEGNDAHDAIYFILGVWKQQGFNAVEDELYHMGEIPEKDWFVNEIREFIQNVYPISPMAEYNRAPVTLVNGMSADMMITFQSI